MALTPAQLEKTLSCAASAKRLSGCSQDEYDKALANVMDNVDRTDVYVQHRPAGAIPGIASTVSRATNGNLIIRFNGSRPDRIATYGFTIKPEDQA